MNSLPVPPKLVPLVNYLNTLQHRASIEAAAGTAHRTSQATLEDVKDFVRFESTNYQRNLVALGPWYEVLVICWRSGQRSPIHNHAQSTCGLKVLSGVCTETYFTHSPCGQGSSRSPATNAKAGHVCASEKTTTRTRCRTCRPRGTTS